MSPISENDTEDTTDDEGASSDGEKKMHMQDKDEQTEGVNTRTCSAKKKPLTKVPGSSSGGESQFFFRLFPFQTPST